MLGVGGGGCLEFENAQMIRRNSKTCSNRIWEGCGLRNYQKFIMNWSFHAENLYELRNWQELWSAIRDIQRSSWPSLREEFCLRFLPSSKNWEESRTTQTIRAKPSPNLSDIGKFLRSILVRKNPQEKLLMIRSFRGQFLQCWQIFPNFVNNWF